MVAVVDPPLWLQNVPYPARMDRQLIALNPEGIVRGLAVAPHTPAPDYTVTVNDGLAVIYGDDEDDQGAYLAVNPEPVAVTIAAPAGQNRVDLIILRVNDPQAGGPAGDNTTVDVLQGTPTSGTAAPPAMPGSAIELARITVNSSTTAIGPAQISGMARSFSRGVGVIELFAGGSTPAWGLVCDGSQRSRTQFADLFSVIGVMWGAGDGSSTFNLPDLRGRAPVGYTSADTLFNAVGKTGGSKNAVVVAHVHPIVHDHPQINTSWAGVHDHAYSKMVESATKAAGSQNAGTSLDTVRTGDSGNHQHTANVPNFTGNSGAASGGVSGTNANMMPFGVLNFVIRV